jgi:uncharacterized protein YbjT (DUF2867 family)
MRTSFMGSLTIEGGRKLRHTQVRQKIRSNNPAQGGQNCGERLIRAPEVPKGLHFRRRRDTLQERKGRTAWLAGATGLVGGFALKQLIGSERYARVVVLTRRTVHTEDPKIDQRVGNFDQLAAMDLPAADDVFCALGTTIKKAGSQEVFRHIDLDFPLALANTALARNVKQFLLVSSVGANGKSKNFYLRTKGELEDAVSAMPFKAIHIFRPSILVGPREERRAGERAGIVFMKLVSPMLAGGLRKYRAIEAQDVARSMVLAAELDGSGKKAYEYDQMMALIQPSGL